MQARQFQHAAPTHRPFVRTPPPSLYSNKLAIFQLSTILTNCSMIAHANSAFELFLWITHLPVVLASNMCVAAVPLRVARAVVATSSMRMTSP
jgi:hypothetical protein